MNQSHIVHVIGTPKSGGAQTNLLTIINSEAFCQFQNSIICIIDDQGELRKSFEAAGVQVHYCPLRWPHGQFTPSYRVDQFLRNHLYFTFPWRLALLLKKIQAELVHTHVTSHVGLQADAVLHQARIPWIWTLHGLYRSRGEDTKEWNKTIRWVNKERAVVTGVSRAALGELTAFEPLLPEKQKVIFNGINLNLLAPAGPNQKKVREGLGVSEAALVFGTAGRLIPIKRHDLLIRAAAKILAAGLDAHFLIAGEGPSYDHLHDLITSLDVGHRVHVVGYQENIADFLSALDVFVLPSDSEALPVALLEACAVGLPCVATSVGGISEILGQDSGILVSANSLEELVTALQAMSMDEIRNDFSKRSRKVAESYSHTKISQQYSYLYRELLDN
jgi:glycosyltransferase involved in cell wall biosynthesis